MISLPLNHNQEYGLASNYFDSGLPSIDQLSALSFVFLLIIRKNLTPVWVFIPHRQVLYQIKPRDQFDIAEV